MKIKPEDLKNYIGKKIRHCRLGYVVTVIALGSKRLFTSDGNDDYISEIADEVWETYEEPKKKVKMWLWIYKTNAKHQEKYAYITSRFYKSEQDAKEAHLGDIVIQRADWTEIEVEE